MVERVQVVIRPVTEADLQALEWEGRYRHFRRLYRMAYLEAQRGRRLLMVAEAQGRVVGQIFIQFSGGRHNLRGVKTGYLHAVRVRPEWRGQGIGTQLIQAAEEELRARGFQRAVLAVSQANEGARRLYERLGYRLFAEDPGRWSYVDDQGRKRHVDEPAFVLDKRL